MPDIPTEEHRYWLLLALDKRYSTRYPTPHVMVIEVERRPNGRFRWRNLSDPLNIWKGVKALRGYIEWGYNFKPLFDLGEVEWGEVKTLEDPHYA